MLASNVGEIKQINHSQKQGENKSAANCDLIFIELPEERKKKKRLVTSFRNCPLVFSPAISAVLRHFTRYHPLNVSIDTLMKIIKKQLLISLP